MFKSCSQCAFIEIDGFPTASKHQLLIPQLIAKTKKLFLPKENPKLMNLHKILNFIINFYFFLFFSKVVMITQSKSEPISANKFESCPE